ncbi:M20 metallopeptidase family protein [Rudaeicoccus suwonensis]|uniref:M20 metallopeptidase family protein n=1 Tax=Rudaeicoccus suwonensis TaxID=657409 RepID=UPI0011A4A654|nr:M20 family metallopeptidase [Rudaeicoccus suwonensis]
MADRTRSAARTLQLAEEMADDLSAIRRRLHRRPEIGLRLPVTQQLIVDELAGTYDELHLGAALDSVVAVIRGGAPGASDGPVVLLRGDMDALPVTEAVESSYTSEVSGAMHACGHDLHVAGLIGAARILHQRREHLAGDVVLMFQPGEEGPGGAIPMLDEGLLDVAGRPVDAAYALHVFSAEYPRGQWFSLPGAVMAAADEVAITVRGRGGHGSAPHTAQDPVPVACEIVLALQTAVTRGFSVFDPVVVTVGCIQGGTKDNIIPDDATLGVTVRTLSPANREAAAAMVERVARGVAAAHGLGVDVVWADGYAPTINHRADYDLGREVVADLFGADRYVDRDYPEMGSEDFSFVLERVPGAYFMLGACMAQDPAAAPDNHSPRAAFDDSVLPDAAAWLAEMALRRCERG